MLSLSSTRTALSDAINVVGPQASFGRICGVSQAAVWKWLNVAGRLPAEHVLTVEAASGVSRHDLRPDIYPRETMADQGRARRFTGVDRRAGSRTALAAMAAE